MFPRRGSVVFQISTLGETSPRRVAWGWGWGEWQAVISKKLHIFCKKQHRCLPPPSSLLPPSLPSFLP